MILDCFFYWSREGFGGSAQVPLPSSAGVSVIGVSEVLTPLFHSVELSKRLWSPTPERARHNSPGWSHPRDEDERGATPGGVL